MSPEQAKGEPLDARSDIFSLGTILYELLTGRRAFDGRTIDETLDQVIAAHPRAVDKLRPDTPAPLVAVVRKAMDRNPAQRYQRASDLRNALADFVEGSRSATTEVSMAARPAEEPAATAWSRAPVKALIGGVAIVAAALIVFLALQPAPAPPPVAAVPAPVLPEPVAPQAGEATAEVTAPAVEETRPTEAKAGPRRRSEASSTAIPVRDGVVNLAVTPWGEVYVDGASRGVSPPLTQLTLPSGSHTIEVRNGSAAPFAVRIELRSGETISLQHRF